MSTTVPSPAHGWARAHRAALAIVLLTIALAAAVSLLAVRLATGSPPVPATSVSGVPLHAISDGCRDAGPGQPC